MIFTATAIPGAYILALERHEDARGWFARAWCEREFEAATGGKCQCVQTNISANRRKGTLRGMHYSVQPFAEAKVVRCIHGSIYDVLLDLRPESPSYLKWVSNSLSRENGLAVFAPVGVAHGFQTLEDDSDVLYQMSEVFDAECARGVRWDDPAFGIAWPLGDVHMSERDRAYAEFGTS